jgi:uncharacterized protein YcbK (DUF882 family)
LKVERSRKATGGHGAIAIALCSVFLASCTTSDQSLELAAPGYSLNGDAVGSSDNNGLQTSAADTGESAGNGQASSANGDSSIHREVAYLPGNRPAVVSTGSDPATAGSEKATAETTTDPASTSAKQEAKSVTSDAADENQTAEAAPAPVAEPKKRGFFATLFGASQSTQPVQKPAQSSTAPGTEATKATQPAASEEPATEKPTETASATTSQPKPAEEASGQQTASTAPAADGGDQTAAATTESTPAIEPKKRGFLAAFFGGSPTAARQDKPAPFAQLASTSSTTAGKAEEPAKTEPLVKLASVARSETSPKAIRASLNDGPYESLPGVRQTELFEIKRKSGLDDDSDVDLHEDEGGLYEVASAAGLARLAPNGLMTQTERVDVACLKPSLVRMLRIVESHYGRKLVVTSGYRSPPYNRRVRGARNSQHMYCAAADIQVPGVSKWELASFVRALPGRGGVGTYCHTNSVHLDIGPERDWNWRCRRRQ